MINYRKGIVKLHVIPERILSEWLWNRYYSSGTTIIMIKYFNCIFIYSIGILNILVVTLQRSHFDGNRMVAFK